MRIHESEAQHAFGRRGRGDNQFVLLAPRVLHAALLWACLLAAATPALAEPVSQPAGWGLGLMLGAPTGLTVKHWNGGANALDLGVGVGPGLRLHADYLWGLAQVMSDKSDVKLDLYLGVGPVLGVSRGWCGTAYRPRGDCRSRGPIYGGARVPFGIEARLVRAPFTFGLELAPGIWLSPDFVDGLLDVLLFARFLL